MLVWAKLNALPVTGMAHPQIRGEENGLQIWKVAANIQNKQSKVTSKWMGLQFGWLAG
jgi:hypothetical protein